MKLINEIQVREHLPDDLTHQQLVEAIRSRASFLHGSRLSFGNAGESDYVVAHLGMLVNIVHRATPYTDFEVKMNMALKGLQTFDFNEPMVYNLPSANRTSVGSRVISGMQTEYWDVLYVNGLLRGGGSRGIMSGYTYFTHNLGLHKSEDDQRTLLWAPVVRIDKFADFRRNNMFSGKIDWPGTVTYWINEDFNPEKAREMGILAIHNIWRRHYLPNLKLGSFRIEYVPNSEMNKLFYAPVKPRINSLLDLRREAEEILVEVRNHALVENKPAIMTALDRVNRDYLGEFISSHTRVSTMSEDERDEADAEAEEEAAAQEEEEAWDDSPAQPAAEPGQFWQIAQEGSAAAPIHQGILGQIENAEQITYQPITREDIERIAAQLSQEPVLQRPNPRYIAAVDPYGPSLINAQGEPVRPEDIANQDAIGYVYTTPRRIGVSYRSAQQQAELLRQIAERERQEARRRAETAEMQRFIAQYPFTPEQAFVPNVVAEEEQIRQRMDEIQRSVVNNPPSSWDGVDALRREYDNLLERLNQIRSQRGSEQESEQERLMREYEQAVMRLRELTDNGPAEVGHGELDSAVRTQHDRDVEQYRQQIEAYLAASPNRMEFQRRSESVSDMAAAYGWSLMLQQGGPIGEPNYGTPGEDPAIAAGISLEEQFRNPQELEPPGGMPVFNEAIAAEMREEDLYVAGIDPYDAEDELEREARELQQTIESQQDDNNNSRHVDSDTNSEDSSNQSPDVLGGGSALGEEETEIF